ncbi:MAG: Rab family GTPase [Satyrvirus sp.]|uniref:Rab family GTPase n=1 Tax=Satyrvirus sp. TaxID=2487771 RepID=A0A3G5AIQ5_9VIRU|nr:MAG: Rab family GTPase [Satyrvirus sp.]
MQTNNYKIVLIGDSGVGKSSLIYWFLNNTTSYNIISTQASSYSTKEYNIDDKIVRFHIWDTAGQERFRSLSKIYYSKSNGCFCVFDVTCQKSFDNLKYWINNYDENNMTEHVILIIANKSDVNKSQWQITETEIINFSQENGYHVVFTNCISGQNINRAFELLSKLIMNMKIDNGPAMENDEKIINLYPPQLPETNKYICRC